LHRRHFQPTGSGSRPSGWRGRPAGLGAANIYNAHDNAMAAARLFNDNAARFRKRMGRDPTDDEFYLMHQQGLGFYTRGALTNPYGNRPPGTQGLLTHESFEAGWSRVLDQKRESFARRDLLANGAAAGITGAPPKLEGSADLRVAFENARAGAKASIKYGGLFKSGTVDWGHPMPATNPGGGS
jgi:hypothetical protein